MSLLGVATHIGAGGASMVLVLQHLESGTSGAIDLFRLVQKQELNNWGD